MREIERLARNDVDNTTMPNTDLSLADVDREPSAEQRVFHRAPIREVPGRYGPVGLERDPQRKEVNPTSQLEFIDAAGEL